MKINSVFFILCYMIMHFCECKEGDKLSETDEGKKRGKRHMPRKNGHYRVMTNMEEILSHKWL